MNQRTLRGLLAPVFFALAIVTGVVNLRVDSHALVWLSLGFTLVGLVFVRDTTQLMTKPFLDDQ